MDKFEILNTISEIYSKGGNILKYLRDIEDSENNSVADIAISYDFQAGTYNSQYKENPGERDAWCSLLAQIINAYLPDDEYILCDAGVGEATTNLPLMRKLRVKPSLSIGFDISWSRILEAIRFSKEFTDLANVQKNFFVGNIFETPFADNSIDIVYTSHALEPNGGKEEQLLSELFRITSKYLILFEPIYEFASEEGKKRMEFHGYVKGLHDWAKKLDYSVVRYEKLDCTLNSLNPTGVIVIEKNVKTQKKGLCDPISKMALTEYEDCFFCKDSLLAYPKINGIPCLTRQHAVLATKFECV